MSKQIEPGMLVRIVAPAHHTGPESREAANQYNGHIGEVLRLYDYHFLFGPRWIVEGSGEHENCWPSSALEPIDHPPTWDDIQTNTGWTPSVPVKSTDLVDA